MYFCFPKHMCVCKSVSLCAFAFCKEHKEWGWDGDLCVKEKMRICIVDSQTSKSTDLDFSMHKTCTRATYFKFEVIVSKVSLYEINLLTKCTFEWVKCLMVIGRLG